MKSKVRKRNERPDSNIEEKVSGDNTDGQSLNKDSYLSNSSETDSLTKVKKYKMKSSETFKDKDDNLVALDVQHSPKKKQKKTKTNKEMSLNLTLHDENPPTDEADADEDDGSKDNTPHSLKRKKKSKKKKNQPNALNLQPNTANLDYLNKWKNDRSNWKFEKVRQIRLISNMFEEEKLPDEHFPIFLEYMNGGSKAVKELMSKLAKEVIEEMEKWESLSEVEKETCPKVDDNKYERARNVLQMLQ